MEPLLSTHSGAECPRTAHPRVLLVEDSEDDAYFFQWTLERLDLSTRLVHVRNGVEAFEFLNTRPAEENPDFIFVDLKMPGMTGFEVLERMRVQGILPGLNVAVLSGSDHPKDVARAKLLGASQYFVKPIPAVLLKAHLLRPPVTSPSAHPTS